MIKRNQSEEQGPGRGVEGWGAAVDVSKSIHMKYIKIIVFEMYQNYQKYFYIYFNIIVDILICFDILILSTTNINFFIKERNKILWKDMKS